MFKLYITVLSYLAVLGLPLTASGQLTPDKFFEDADYGSFELSPNGQLIAIADRRKTPDSVLIMDLNNRSDVKALGMGKADINWARWITNDRLLVSVKVERTVKLSPGYYTVEGGRRTSLMSGVSYSRLVAINKDGSAPAEMMSTAKGRLKRSTNLTSVTSILASDPDHILMPAFSDRMNLYRVNVHTGDSERIEKGGVNTLSWDVDPQGTPIARYDSSSNGRYIKVLTKNSAGKWKKIGTVKRENLDRFRVLSSADQPGLFLVAGRPEGADKAGVYTYDILTQTYRDKIAARNDVDLQNALMDDADRYIASAFFTDRLSYQFKDPRLGKHFAAVDQFFEADFNIKIQSVSANGKRWLLNVDGPSEPGAYYDYDLDKTQVKFIAQTFLDLDRTALGATDAVAYTARDGLPLTGYLNYPAGGMTARTPMIVFVHGGPEKRDVYGFNPMVQYLTSQGYSVFQPNFRGSSGFGKAFAEMNRDEWGGKMQDDVTDGVAHLIRSGKASRGNICIAGVSYGGYSALMGALQADDLYKCAVSINGVSDLPGILAFDADRFGKKSETYDYMLKMLGDPKEQAQSQKRRSPVYRAKDLDIPLLIIHGDQDEVVPVAQSERLYDAIIAQGGSASFHKLEGVNHSLSGLSPSARETESEDDDDYVYGYKKTMELMNNFFARYLR